MTREEILEDYVVNEQGIITSPGKFEGQMLYAPHFWEASLHSMSDWERSDESFHYYGFKVLLADRKKFPELEPDVIQVEIWEDEQGFVALHRFDGDVSPEALDRRANV